MTKQPDYTRESLRILFRKQAAFRQWLIDQGDLIVDDDDLRYGDNSPSTSVESILYVGPSRS